MYLPFLIEDGRVYKATPPLYSIKQGSKKKFFVDNSDMIEFNMKEFSNKYSVTVGKNKIEGRELKKLFIKNADYLYELNTAATNNALSPLLLETILIAYINKKDTLKAIKDKYRFVKESKIKGVEKIEVSDDQLYTAYITDSLINECKNAIKILKDNDYLNFKVNGENATLYQLMNIYNSIAPTGISRYKGLGEMNSEDLAASTILPENRTLIRYTVDSVKEEIATIRELESNKKKILAMIENVNREDLRD